MAHAQCRGQIWRIRQKFKVNPSDNQSVTNCHGLKMTPAATQTAPETSTKPRRNADVFFETETIIRHLLEPKPVKR
jgi:hypothetical protein